MPRPRVKYMRITYEPEFIDFCHRSSTSETVLSDLPDEILNKIFGYLTPESLVQISKLGNKRLNTATFFKSADFSKCNTINNEDLHFFFIKETLNLKNVKEINFNNVFFALPSTLTTCIKRCKNLTKLCAFNCGLDFSHICSIFDSCKNLKELYWSLDLVDEHNPSLELPNGTVTNLRKLGILIELENYLKFRESIDAVHFWCSSLQVVIATNFPRNTYELSANLNRQKPIYCIRKYTNQHTRETVKGYQDCLFSSDVDPQRMEVFMQDMSWLKDNNRQGSSSSEESEDKRAGYYHAGILQLTTEIILPLPSLPNNSVKSLNIVINDNLDDSLVNIINHLPRMAKMGETTLKHLSICKRENNTTLASYNYMNSLCISRIVCDLTFKSYNLTVLDLSEVHMASVFPLPFNCPFKQLKVINISACCLAPCPEMDESEPHRAVYEKMFAERDFEKFVLNSDKVEEFGLYRCKACPLGPSDEKLNCISTWKELKSLTLKGVGTVSKCQFLTGVAEKCPKLRKLVLVELGERNVCHYIPSVVHILKKSKELIFLKLNQSGFCLMDTVFWYNISISMNLQGLCLSTAVHVEDALLFCDVIVTVLKRLPYLHIFHLKAIGLCKNLLTHVEQIMLDKGVKFPKIVTINDYSGVTECYKTHLPMI